MCYFSRGTWAPADFFLTSGYCWGAMEPIPTDTKVRRHFTLALIKFLPIIPWKQSRFSASHNSSSDIQKDISRSWKCNGPVYDVSWRGRWDRSMMSAAEGGGASLWCQVTREAGPVYGVSWLGRRSQSMVSSDEGGGAGLWCQLTREAYHRGAHCGPLQPAAC